MKQQDALSALRDLWLARPEDQRGSQMIDPFLNQINLERPQLLQFKCAGRRMGAAKSYLLKFASSAPSTATQIS